MGMVSLYALRLAVHTLSETGSTAGRLYALSTVGSLTGNFASALLLIPLIGTRRTFLVYAFAFAIVAMVGLRRPVVALVPAAMVLLMLLPVGTIRSGTADGRRVLHEAETEYQYVRVVENGRGDRLLELNEGQAIHSMRRPGSYPTDQHLGRVPRRTVRRAEPATTADRDPRQRGWHQGPGLWPVLPRDLRRMGWRSTASSLASGEPSSTAA